MSWLDLWYEHNQTWVSIQNGGPMVLKKAYCRVGLEFGAFRTGQNTHKLCATPDIF